MELKEKDIEEKYINIFTTKKIIELIEKENIGDKIHLHEKIWFKNEVNVRKANIKFAPTKGELDEYTKCKLNIQYFANKYCKIKREDGTVGPMKLRDYQKEILNLYYNNNYSILMASRQTGKCNSLISKVSIKNNSDISNIITMGELYYSYIRIERKLTLIENVKLFLYKILSKL